MPTEPNPNRLRVAAISFLNPAPLLYNFEHEPERSRLSQRYEVRFTLPSQCAADLTSGEADLGLIPIASLATLPEVAAVPGCTIASLDRVRSIQLILRPGTTLENIRSIAADSASRSSAAYVQTLLRAFYKNDPAFHQQPADLAAMLAEHDAALLIGDPALIAVDRLERFGDFAACTWVDVAALWRQHTGLPWVAAVWAVRPSALQRCNMTPEDLVADLQHSRDSGLQNIEALVTEWSGKLPLRPATIRHYLTANIHYTLDAPCLAAIDRFYTLATETGVLPAYHLQTLPPDR